MMNGHEKPNARSYSLMELSYAKPFDESKVKRAKDGRFGEKPGEQKHEERPSKDRSKALATFNKKSASRRGMVRADMPFSPIRFEDDFVVPKEISTGKGEIKMETVDIADLSATQKTVSKEIVTEFVKNPDKKSDIGHRNPKGVILLAKVRGKTLIMDGHHRVQAALLRGEKTIKGAFIDKVSKTELAAQQAESKKKDAQLEKDNPKEAFKTKITILKGAVEDGELSELEAKWQTKQLTEEFEKSQKGKGKGKGKSAKESRLPLSTLRRLYPGL